MTGPLDGVTVVSVEHAVAAPFATRQLADLGARVIKIERPGTGDFSRAYDHAVHGMSSHFVWLNRGKESVMLDLKTPTGLDTLHGLLASADVFVQNLGPGAADRLDLAAPSLRERYPRLVVCGISGYGENGPYRDHKAYDLLIQCEAGLMSITGTPEEPVRTGIPVADIAAAMYAFSGVLTALYEREHTGVGSRVDVTMLEALAEWMGHPYHFVDNQGGALPRTGNQHSTIAPYGSFITADAAVMLAVQNDREWVSFCRQVLWRPELVGRPVFADNPARIAHHTELRSVIEETFRPLTTAQVIERLEKTGIAHALFRSVAQAINHPQLAARDRWRQIDTPVGPTSALLPPVTVNGREPLMDAVPALGEHTDAILREFQQRP